VFFYSILIIFSYCLVAKKAEENKYFLDKYVLDSDLLQVFVPFLVQVVFLILF
jgi:hypothetical protein